MAFRLSFSILSCLILLCSSVVVSDLNNGLVELDYHFFEMDRSELLDKLDKYEKESLEAQDTLSILRCVSLRARISAEKAQYKEAFELLQAVKPMAFQSKDDLVKATYYFRVGSNYFYHMEETVTHQESYDEANVLNDSALVCLNRVINKEIEERDPILYYKACYLKAISLRRVARYEEALEILKEAESVVRKNDLAKYQIQILNIRASILEELGRFDEANELFLFGIQEVEKKGTEEEKATLYYNYGTFLYLLERDKEALSILLKSDSIAHLTDVRSEDMYLTCETIHELYSFEGDFESAYLWSQKAFEHYKEIETGEMRLKFEQMQIETANFENERLAFEHAEKRFEAEKESQKQTRRAVRLGYTAIFLLILIGGAFYFNRLNAKNKTLVHEKEVSDLIRQQEIASMESMIEGQETERIRLGRELHDHIGSLLSTLGMHFTSAFEKNFGTSVQENKEASRVLELLDNTVQETRKLSHDLMTGVLNRFGLVSAIRDLCDQISETGKVNVLFNSIGMDERLAPLIELNVYRVAQELISNALKHASPENIRVNLVKKIDAVSLTVKDDGIGMSEAVFNQSKGAGSTNVKGRVASMQGKIEIDDQVERGTMIKIIIPIKA
ncbi:MAG: ATP-binding protein [Flavobacteriales bacterium]|nr:ATP-binding protein [Flavobacteriales bacterium]